MSGFLGKFGGLDDAGLITLANMCEYAERHEDMCLVMTEFVKRKCKSKTDLSSSERNLLSVAYKNVVGTKRAAWRSVNGDEDSPKDLVERYRKNIELELIAACNEIIALLRDHLVPATTEKQSEAHVFFLKMMADYYRYMAEIVGDQDPSHGDAAIKHYKDAMDVAKDIMGETHPARLGLALNMSVCHYEIKKEREKACEIAKTAFDSAIQRLDSMDDDNYQDATLIMQLLRDNLTLWTTDPEDANED